MHKFLQATVFSFSVFVVTDQAIGQGIPVFDATQVARSIEQIQNQLEQIKKMESQLKEAQRLYDSFNKTGDMSALLAFFNDPRTKQYLPQDAQQLNKLLQGQSIGSYGNINSRANEIRLTNRQMAPNPNAANDYYYQELERIGIRTSTEIALGEKIYSTATDRQASLQKLAQQVSTATDYRELANIQSMILLEIASMQNEFLRLQGATMMLKADEKMDFQRGNEKNRQITTDLIKALNQPIPNTK